MASSSSSSPATRYEVFLSFRGEDTRNGFTSHLHEALSSSKILTFIDNNLRRGDDISPSLLTTIEESIISVIIFSEDYADSKWCLKELAKILQCRKLKGQIVIPVFYGVDPSHIRNQTGKFGLAFDKLKERLDNGEMDLDDVRSHLEEAANISGWNSQIISPDSELIKSIVGDILKKLNQMTLILPSNLVGIDSHIERVEALLCLESPKFRSVGLWGMGGIGKTTTAQAVFNRIFSRFDGFLFVENVSKKLKSQSVNGLWEEIELKLFEEERLKMGNRTLRPEFIMTQFQCKKFLLVLDDLDDVLLAKKLFVKWSHLLCGGSRVLVTSRYRQVLMNIVGDQNHIYDVEGLNKKDGLRLFNLHAFKQNHPTSDRLELSWRVLSYTSGNPLALVVLGCMLFDKSKEDWCSALDELGEEPFPDIQKVLRISYDALCDEEKTIFLDIASFLVKKKLDFVVAYYQGSVKRIKYKIGILVDKSLITIAKDKQLEMHDLLKEMGRSIESTKRPKKRTRIWNLKDVTHVFKKRKRSLMIEAISINLSQGERISEFDCSVLARLDCLRFLEFHHHGDKESKVRFCWKRFRGFPKELRYFRWDSYPHNSLPSNFSFENLVELHMPFTAIRELWTGKQNIMNLKVINLRGAKKLVEFPDVSEGRNIESINLYGCKSLVKLPPIQHLPKLEILIISKSMCPPNKRTWKWDFNDVTHIFKKRKLKERLREELPSSLVGIGSHVERVETLLCLESPQLRIVGLWGMGGIGKTTIARAVFKHICSRFDAFHFVENVSNKLRNQSVDGLREKIVLKLLQEESVNMGNRTLRHDFIMKKFQRKKVLIVLDNVDNVIEVKKLLAGENDDLFSGGSRILVTSRNRQVLRTMGVEIYEVEGLNEEDGVQLFSLCAFKQNHPTSDRLELTKRVLRYARGNPLALVVLGHALFDKSKEEWISAVDELGKDFFPSIVDMLRISYDALCNLEKTIFQDIASFWVGKKLDFVAAYYQEPVRKIEYMISNLVDKSLITVSKNKKLEMHVLLEEMGLMFESRKRFKEYSRIWLKDVTQISNVTQISMKRKDETFERLFKYAGEVKLCMQPLAFIFDGDKIYLTEIKPTKYGDIIEVRVKKS